MEHVLYEKIGRIAYITLNRPEKLNAVGIQATEELGEIWKDFSNDADTWVGILSGNGKSFCAGADVEKLDLGKEGKWTLDKSLILGKKRMGPSNYNVWKPLIAAVRGHALGAGFYLALQCDIRIASDDAQFGLPEPMVGIPTMFTPYLRDYLPRGMAMELLLMGERITSERAYEMGLVNKVVAQDQLMNAAEEMANRICQKGPMCLRAMKEVYHRSRYMDADDTLSLIKDMFEPVMNSEDAGEGKRAFREKRKPEWKGF